MQNKKLLFISLLVVSLLTGFFALLNLLGPSIPPTNYPYKVISVTDGDTIVVKTAKGEQQKVRLLGINSPELANGSVPAECFSNEAKAFTKQVALDKYVRLEYDQDKQDRFGRTLAYVFIKDNPIMLNQLIMQNGYADFYLDRINNKYQKQFMQDYLNAQKQFKGYFGACGEKQYESKCVIKGNVDPRGNKYYHLPGDRYYDITVIRPDKQDHWWCTIKQAENKGFARTTDH